MDDMVLQVSDAGDGEGVDDALVRLEVPTFGGGEVLGQMSRWHKKKETAEQCSVSMELMTKKKNTIISAFQVTMDGKSLAVGRVDHQGRSTDSSLSISS